MQLCVLSDTLLAAFSSVGGVHRVYDVHEVLDLLEKYLSKNKSLIDPLNPKFVNCANTDLGRAFGVEKFEFKDVGKLLAKSVKAVNSTDAPVDSRNFILNCNQNEPGLNSCGEYIRTSAGNVSTTQCTTNSIFSVPSTSHASSQHFRKLDRTNGFKIPVPEIPDYLSGPESEHTYQGYETAVVDDSDSDAEEKSVHSAQEIEEEVEEYELASESETELKSQNDTESDFENIVLIFGVEERDDSDDCFADNSSSSSSDSEGHSTEDEKDQWSCVSCGIKNKPFMRYCEKCWQLRKDWYPDPPKRLRKRKPRVKKDKKRFSSECDEKAASKEEKVNKDTKKGEVKIDKEEEVLTEDVKEEETNEDDKGSSSDTLVRSSSIASTSTVASTCSSSTASSQDSGFGSQELSSFDVYIPVPTRKRKLSESEEGKRKAQKTVGDVDEIADKLVKKLPKFSKTSKGIRWLKSEAAKELLELIEDVISDSEGEVVDTQDVCSLCYSRPKDASIIHGRLSHIGFCYPCAKRLYNSKSKCPICRRKIHMITKNAYV